MKNLDIRTACMQAGIKQWRLAEALGVSETHFSRKFRDELPKEEKEKILGVIDRLAQEKQGVV